LIERGIGLTEDIYIFDIDGCVMPPIISNFNDNHTSRKETVKEVINNGHTIKLYPDFIKYYKRNCERSESVIFITGRKKSEFGKLTESQLKPLNKLKRYRVIYFPERNIHESDIYFEWKIKKVQELINNNGKNQYNDYSKVRFFKIFDDMDEHFPKIKEFSEKLGLLVNLFLINGGKSWDSELNDI